MATGIALAAAGITHPEYPVSLPQCGFGEGFGWVECRQGRRAHLGVIPRIPDSDSGHRGKTIRPRPPPEAKVALFRSRLTRVRAFCSRTVALDPSDPPDPLPSRKSSHPCQTSLRRSAAGIGASSEPTLQCCVKVAF